MFTFYQFLFVGIVLKYRYLLLLLLVALLNACTTINLWQGYQSGEYVEILGEWPTLEQQLRETGVEYYCHSYLDNNDQQRCYVEKPFKRRLSEFFAILYKTPKAVIVDSFTTIFVVAAITIDAFVEVCGVGGYACYHYD